MTTEHGSTDDTRIRLTAAGPLDCEYRQRYRKTADGALEPMPGAIRITGDTFALALPLDTAAELRDQLIAALDGRVSALGYAQMVRDKHGTAIGRILEKSRAAEYELRLPEPAVRRLELSKPGARHITVEYGYQGGLSMAWRDRDIAHGTRAVNTVLAWFDEADTTH